MISRLRVENFQSHKDTGISFHPGVNVIIGPSDSGKTALIRALKWVVFNKPTGEEFRSSWGGDTLVEINFPDDSYVQRIKKKSDNLYSLSGEEFRAFGRNVPEPVSSFLNMSRINLLGQFDPPFMIGWTPGERGEFLNRICNFTDIDRGIKTANQMIRSERGRIKGLEAEMERLIEERKALPDIDSMEKDLCEIEEKEDRLDGLLKDLADIEDLVDQYGKADKRFDEYASLLTCEGILTGLISKQDRANDLLEEIEDLEEILLNLEDAEKNEAKYIKLIEIREKDFQDEFPDICPLCGGEVDESERQKILR